MKQRSRKKVTRKKVVKRSSMKVVKLSTKKLAKKTFSYLDRFNQFNTVTTLLDSFINGEKLCVINGSLGSKIDMEKIFGTPSMYGEAWIGIATDTGHKLAVKKIPLGKSDQGTSFTPTQFLTGDSAWVEIAAYIFCSLLVVSKVCPNLPIMYKYFWCPKCTFVNKKIGGSPTKPCVLVANELADGDLKMYLEKRPEIWNPDVVDSIVFQIAAGLYSLKKFYNMTHNDLHWGNVLIHEIKPSGFWHYKIDKKDYYVPNFGFMCTLWDFGMVHVPGKIRGRSDFSLLSTNSDETDIGRIVSIMDDKLRKKKFAKFMKIKRHPLLAHIVKYENEITLKQVIKLFHKFTKKPNDDSDIIDDFNMDISKQTLQQAHPDHLKKYVYMR